MAEALSNGGGGRTRTYEGRSQRIYSAPPLPLGTHPHIIWPDGRPGWIRTSAPCGRGLQSRAINHSATDPQSGQTTCFVVLEMPMGLAPMMRINLRDLQSRPFAARVTASFQNGYVGVHESSAEAVGFEPTAPVRVRSLSKGVLSASQPRLRRTLTNICWRTGEDSNLRGLSPHPLSKRARSTTLPPVRCLSIDGGGRGI